jgi:glutaredoxin
MIRIIGTLGCINCIKVKKAFEDKNIEFEYIIFNNLSSEEQDNIIKIAEQNCIGSFPIIFNNEEVSTLENVLNK